MQPLPLKRAKADHSLPRLPSSPHSNGRAVSSSSASAAVASNNPFRRRHVSQPDHAPPPLPPRRPSVPPSLPPRRTRASSASTTASSVRANPTSLTAPSNIIRQSLLAASAGTSSSDLSLHVIKRSPSGHSIHSNQASRTPRNIVQEVSSALDLADLDAKPPSFSETSRSWLQQDPDLRLWSCTDVLAEDCQTPPRYAMIIVNQPIPSREIFRRAWRACK